MGLPASSRDSHIRVYAKKLKTYAKLTNDLAESYIQLSNYDTFITSLTDGFEHILFTAIYIYIYVETHFGLYTKLETFVSNTFPLVIILCQSCSVTGFK